MGEKNKGKVKIAKEEEEKKNNGEEKKKPQKTTKLKEIYVEILNDEDDEENVRENVREKESDKDRKAIPKKPALKQTEKVEDEQPKIKETTFDLEAGPSKEPDGSFIVVVNRPGLEEEVSVRNMNIRETSTVKDRERAATMGFNLNQMYDTTVGRRSEKDNMPTDTELSACEEAFLQAVEQSDLSTTERLLSEGADVNTSREDDITGLHMAAERGDLQMIKLLIAQPDVNINTRTIYGLTPLYLASQFGRDSIVSLLLSNKAKVNKRDQMGRTALHVAVFQGHFNIVLLLLRHGANVNAQDIFGDAPLYICIIPRPNPKIANFLLQMGADPNVKGVDSKGILLEAVLNSNLPNSIKVVKMLVQSGANINTVDSIGGRSVLHLVAMTGDVEMAEVLIALGANVHAKNYAGRTPLEVARLNESYGVYSLLNSMIN